MCQKAGRVSDAASTALSIMARSVPHTDTDPSSVMSILTPVRSIISLMVLPLWPRLYIMDEVMSKAIAEPRKEVGLYAPKIVQIQIDPLKIGDVVGQ